MTDRTMTRTDRTLAAIADRLDEVEAKLSRVLMFAMKMEARESWVDHYRAHAQDGLPRI